MKLRKISALALALILLLSLPALAAGTYADVEEEAWYAQAVEYCGENGLMDGLGDGLFGPEAPTSRGMVVTVLYRMAGNPALTREEPFPDVAEDAWYARAAAWAAVQGIALGRPEGGFAPEEDVTRQDLAVLLWRSLESPTPAAEAEPFADEAEISPYALEAVRWARAAGLVNGMGNGCFAPRKSATRAELACVLMKLDLYLRGESLPEETAAPCGLTGDGAGGLLVTDTNNKCVWLLREGTATRVAGAESPEDVNGIPLGGYRDGAAGDSLFLRPWAIAPYLNVWAVSDTENNALRLFTEEGVVTLSALPGEEGLPLSEDGAVRFDRPMGLAADEAGNLYIADTGSGTIRLLRPDGTLITLLSGLEEPTGLCWHQDSLYIAETEKHRILKLTDGVLEILAGAGQEGYADGPAAEALFSSPMGIAVDDLGRVYVADTVNGAVRRIADGQVVTLVQSRPDSPQLWPISPVGLLVQGDSLYIADNFSGKLLRIHIG